MCLAERENAIKLKQVTAEVQELVRSGDSTERRRMADLP